MTKKFDQHLDHAEEHEAPTPLPLRAPSSAPKKFPIAALGKTMAGAARAIIDMVQCPDAIAAQSILATASLVSQAHADVVHPVTGDSRPLSLALVTVAASGERKSAADTIALEPVRLREAELWEAHEDDKLEYHTEVEAYDRAKKTILIKQKSASKDEIKQQLAALGPPPKPPLKPVLTAPDPTIEGLHKLMAIGEPSFGLFNDEGGSFLGGYSMGDESRLRTAAHLSHLWDGAPVKRVRGGDGVSLLRGRRLTVHLMIQPGVADQLLGDEMLSQQGLLSRVLVSSPPSKVGTRLQRPLKPGTPAALKRYQTIMLKLLRLPQPRGGSQGQELNPRPLPLSGEALARWSEFADECERAMAFGGEFKPIQGFANKLAEHVLRIAGVLQMIDNHRSKFISADAIERAIKLGRYYAGEALRLADESIVSEQVRKAESLLTWLKDNHKNGLVHLAHIYQNGPRPVRKAQEARATMRVLESHHLVKPIKGGAKIDGKRYAEVWELMPGST